jgi:hypothetical protein
MRVASFGVNQSTGIAKKFLGKLKRNAASLMLLQRLPIVSELFISIAYTFDPRNLKGVLIFAKINYRIARQAV